MGGEGRGLGLALAERGCARAAADVVDFRAGQHEQQPLEYRLRHPTFRAKQTGSLEGIKLLHGRYYATRRRLANGRFPEAIARQDPKRAKRWRGWDAIRMGVQASAKGWGR